jgi:hypothetical protein
LGELFSAYARFFRAAPWECLHQTPPLFIEWLDGAEPWVVSVLGAALGEYGVSVYSEIDDFGSHMAWDEEEPSILGMKGWMVHLGFQYREELPRVMLKEVSRAGWEVADVDAYPYLVPVLTPGGGLQECLVRRLVEVMNEVSALAEELGETLRSPKGATVIKTEGRLRIRYLRPADEEEEWDEVGWDDDEEGLDAETVQELVEELQEWLDEEDDQGEGAEGGGDPGLSGGSAGGPDGLVAGLLDEIREGGLENLAEIRGLAHRRMEAYNAAPQDELAGISPHQAQELLMGGVSGEGPLRLSDVLGLDELEPSSFLFNARAFLAAAGEAGGAPLTQTGNLKRVFVAEMLERLRLPEDYLDRLHRYNKVVNEMDVGLLHVLRVNLELAGLIRKRKGRFHLTRKGRELMRPQAAGALFQHLFQVHFGEFNLAYPGREEDRLGLQGALPLLLWKMSRRAQDWISVEELTPVLLPDNVVRMGIDDEGSRRRVDMMVYYHILRPLMVFGLLEEARDDAPEDELYPGWDPSEINLRVTPLFGRFLAFEWA